MENGMLSHGKLGLAIMMANRYVVETFRGRDEN